LKSRETSSMATGEPLKTETDSQH